MAVHARRPRKTEVHEVLGNERRQLVLVELRKRFGRASLSDLADAVAAAEASDGDGSRRKSVYNALRQTHLPRLEEAGAVRYDRDAGRVTLRPGVRQVDRYMDVETGYGVTWAELYRSLSLVGFMTLLATQLDLSFLPRRAALPVAVAFLVLLVVATAAQLWSQRWRYVRWVGDAEEP